jgi:ATP-binding cassette subfamily C (CFTR/MRP) protein 1
LFDPVNGLPTVPSITSPSPMPPIPIDRTTSPPKDAQPHQSVDLTAPHATPMLDAARIQDIPVEPVEPDAPVAQSIPPTSLHDGMLDRAWWWSVLSMGFLGPILSLGNKRALQIGDIPMFSVKDEPAAVVAVVQAEWEKRIAKDPSTGSAVPKVSHPLARTLFACYGWRILAGALSTMFGRWVLIVTPLFTKEFLTWIRADSSASGKSAGFLFEFARGTLGYGIGIVVLLFFILILASVYSNHSYYQGVRMGCSFRGALMSLIFEKSLRCPAFARAPDKVEKGEKPLQGGGGGGGGTGQTVNIMANDTQQIFDAATMMHFTWVEPLFIIFTIILMYTEIGFAALPAGGLMLLLFPVQILVARRIGRNRGQMVRHTDARVKILSEILQGIRVIKFYAWEVPMAERVQEIRVLELACVKYALLLKSFNLLTLFFWPVFVSMVTFIVYVALGEHLTVVKSIEILAFVNVLAKPITVLPLALIACAEVRVSIRRIEKYLLGDELERSPQLLMESDEASQQSDPQPSPDVLMSPQETTGLLDRQASPQTPFPSSQQPQLGLELAALATKADRPASSLRPSPIFVESRRTLPSSSLAITVSSASFAWDRSASSSAAPALRDITFEVPKGGLIGVIGSVGAGKTTLFSALLGELVKVRGSVSIRGRLAYMSQSAWIQNCTLKDNILFGLPFDPVRYQAAIEAAALATDLLLLPAGDATEIGERGITLS